MQRMMREMEDPRAMPVMAPALKVCFFGLAEGVLSLGADTDEWGEWSMVTMLGAKFAGNNACETEKFLCSKSTNRYASWRNARPSMYWSGLDSRWRGK